METLATAESTLQEFVGQTANTIKHVGDGAASQRASLLSEAPLLTQYLLIASERGLESDAVMF